MIDKNGFLSKDIEGWKAKHRADNSRLFQLAEELNEFAHATMLKLEVASRDPAEVFAACSYVRVMSSFQSIVILSEIGLINEAKIILRTLAETMFAVVAIAKDRDFSRELINQELLDRKRTNTTIKRHLENGGSLFSEVTLDEVEKRIKDLQEEIREKGVKLMYKSDLAKAAGFEDYYDTLYHILCSSVHINVRDLAKYLSIKEDGTIEAINWGPDVREIGDILFPAIEVMVFVLKALHDLFDLEFSDDWEPLYQEYSEIGHEQAVAEG